MAIYLLHILIGAGSRVALHMVGIRGVFLYLTVEVVFGVTVPIVLFMLAVRSGTAGLAGFGAAPSRQSLGLGRSRS
jgi:hypothetical protein